MVWKFSLNEFSELKYDKDPTVFETFNAHCTAFESCYKLEPVVTFRTLTSVVEIWLLGRAKSVLNCAHILIGLRDNFLWGVGKLTRT